jgi:hypothetical protein
VIRNSMIREMTSLQRTLGRLQSHRVLSWPSIFFRPGPAPPQIDMFPKSLPPEINVHYFHQKYRQYSGSAFILCQLRRRSSTRGLEGVVDVTDL